MASSDMPSVGQTVWCDEYKNGIITGIYWEFELVYCDFYDNGRHVLELDDMLGYFDERLNQWVIPYIGD